MFMYIYIYICTYTWKGFILQWWKTDELAACVALRDCDYVVACVAACGAVRVGEKPKRHFELIEMDFFIWGGYGK